MMAVAGDASGDRNQKGTQEIWSIYLKKTDFIKSGNENRDYFLLLPFVFFILVPAFVNKCF